VRIPRMTRGGKLPKKIHHDPPTKRGRLLCLCRSAASNQVNTFNCPPVNFAYERRAGWQDERPEKDDLSLAKTSAASGINDISSR
jgi:hypothetical protein